MISKKLSIIADKLNGEVYGTDVAFNGVSIDSRTLQKNNLFIAIGGEKVNGHDYIEQAIALGASAICVSQQVDYDVPQLIVKDTRIALGDMARYYRSLFKGPVVALTGSCGKTTTKTLIKHILSQAGKVHATEGNLNNDYGVPLTILSMDLSANFAVIEMGANHAKEIAYLTHIAKPDIALITNAGPVHLEGFKSIQGVAEGKGEIFEGLSETGIALINEDDQFRDYWISVNAGSRYITFGLSEHADVHAEDIDFNDDLSTCFKLQTLPGSIDVKLSLLGEHNVMNALSASCVGVALNIPLKKIKQGLEETAAVDKRFVEKVTKDGAKIIDDTYNANPVAMEMALKFLSKKKGQKILIIGDMGELGHDSVFYHQSLGEKAKESGVNQLYAIGEFTKHTVKSFGENGFHFNAHDDMLEALRGKVKKDTIVLVKGSRSARMEKIVSALATP